MRSIRKSIVMIAVMIAMLILPVAGIQTKAASNSDAMKAYNSYLKKQLKHKKESLKQFYLVDIDQNKVKELMYCDGEMIWFYTYQKGKMKKIGEIPDNVILDIQYNKKQKSVIYWEGGAHDGESGVYKIVNGKIDRVCSYGSYCNYDKESAYDSTYTFTINGEEVKLSKYKAFVKKYEKGAICYEGRELTKSNINKYCK